MPEGEIIITPDQAAMPGLIAVIDRNFEEVYPAYIEGEAVDNGICVDPDGGIYLVTSKYMRKLVWTGDRLSMDEADGAWKEGYDYVPEKEGGLWLSRGSGLLLPYRSPSRWPPQFKYRKLIIRGSHSSPAVPTSLPGS